MQSSVLMRVFLTVSSDSIMERRLGDLRPPCCTEDDEVGVKGGPNPSARRAAANDDSAVVAVPMVFNEWAGENDGDRGGRTLLLECRGVVGRGDGADDEGPIGTKPKGEALRCV